MNCLLYEWRDAAVMVDCGVMFHDEEIGVNLIHPSFEHLAADPGRLKALVVTHGHEDHAGAIPFLLRALRVPVFASPFTLRIVHDKIREMPPDDEVRLQPLRPGDDLDVGPFRITAAGVNHSIPHALALFLRTPAGNVLHTSDFKIGAAADPDPFERERFIAFGAEGVDLLLSDSTNVERPGMCGSESAVAASLGEIVARAAGNVVVTLFPSNVRRVAGVIGLAAAAGRRTVLVGRSMESYYRNACQAGVIAAGPGTPAPLSSPPRGGDGPLLFLAAGSQGEPGSALGKIARGEHRRIRLEPGDTVVFSSRHIPGNEMGIGLMMDDLARRGAVIRHVETEPDVHVSGHAHAGDLEEMIRLTGPAGFVPIHGNYRHLARHARLAAGMGVPRTLVVEDGEAVELEGGALRRGGRVPTGRVHVDCLLEVGEEVLATRRRLAEGGMTSALVVAAPRGGGRPAVTISCHGVCDPLHAGDIEEAAREALVEKLAELAERGITEPARKRGKLTRCVERTLAKVLGRSSFAAVELVETPEEP